MKRILISVLILSIVAAFFVQTAIPASAAASAGSGDLNDDRVINMSDVMILASVFNTVKGDSRYNESYDLNSDGAVNMSDVMIVAGKFNSVLPNYTNTPTKTSTPTKAPTYTPTLKPTPTPTPASKFHCFLLLGQSNMNGFPRALESDKVLNSRILSLGYTSNQWAVACPPLNDPWRNPIGPGDWFAKTIINKIPANDTIGLIPCAVSGQGIDYFMTTKYSWIIQRAKLAQQKGGVIEGILFHQGCNDTGNTAWPGKVSTFISNIKKDLGLGDIPFLAGELLYTGNSASHNPLVNKLPSLIKNCYVVSAQGLVKDPEDTLNVHFGHDSQVTLGKRYAEKMIQALGW